LLEEDLEVGGVDKVVQKARDLLRVVLSRLSLYVPDLQSQKTQST
jgi:hypothetical protein